MTPSDLRKMTLDELRTTLKAMLSTEWHQALSGKSKQEIGEAAHLLLTVQRTRLRLENAALREIRQQLQAHEMELLTSQRDLSRARQDMDNVTTLLKATTGFLRVVGRIVNLA